MLEDLKSKIVTVAKLAEKENLCKYKSGNFSQKDSDSGYVAITPSGLSRDKLTVDDIIIVDMDGNVIEHGRIDKPSSELPMHLQAYKCRPDITSVIHTHSHYATAFAICGKEIQPVVFEALVYGVKTRVAEYAMPGTPELAMSIVEPLQEADVALMKNHGVLIVGDDILDTYNKARYVEDVAQIYHYALSITNGKPDVIPMSQFETYVKEIGGNG